MSVGRRVAPNYTTQSAAQYKANIDAAFAVDGRLSGWFAPHQVYAGSPNPDLAVELDAGFIWHGSNIAEVASQIVGGIAIPAASNSRIDRVVINGVTGVASVITGTPTAGTPVAPDLTANSVPICQVLIAYTDTAVLDSMITDERVFQTMPNLPTGAGLDYFGSGSVPSGFLACDGSNVSRTTYAALFAAIGTTWGVGDGSTTFTLPDSRRKVAVGSGGTGTSTLGNAVGDTGGEETHAQTGGELASHTHTGTTGGMSANNPHSHSIGASSTSGVSQSNILGASGITFWGNTEASNIDHSHNFTSNSSGSSTGANVMQPGYVVQKIIKY